MADKYLNPAGLSAVWAKIKERFTSVDSRLDELEAWRLDMMYPYRGVEYLESGAKPDNNTQYINTNYFATGSTRVVIDMQLLANEGGYRIMGTQVDEPRFRFGTYDARQYFVRYASLAAYNVNYGSYIPTDRHTFEVGRYFKIDGNTIRDFGAQTFTTNYTLLLFAINAATLVDNAHMKLYSCQIYEGNELVRDFVPVRHQILHINGLYDKLSGTLYTNKGSGNFSVGADTEERYA